MRAVSNLADFLHFFDFVLFRYVARAHSELLLDGSSCPYITVVIIIVLFRRLTPPPPVKSTWLINQAPRLLIVRSQGQKFWLPTANFIAAIK